MQGKRDYFKALTGMTYEEAFKSKRRPYKESIDKMFKQSRSKYPLITLGIGESEVSISQEEREHLLCTGRTRQGKSRLAIHLIQKDIKAGNGVCVLDPSDRGDTANQILNYCIKQGFEKVVVIDPYHRYKYGVLCGLNPFARKKNEMGETEYAYEEASVETILSTFAVLFGVKDPAEIPRINRYLPALLRVLWHSKMTLHETMYFTHQMYIEQRRFMYDNLSPHDIDVLDLESAFLPKNFSEFQSTVNRVKTITKSTLDYMFAVREGVQFTELISQGWVILVNLYSGFGLTPLHTRFLATSIINEMIFAVDRLRYAGWKGRYYIYIDEAGDYANRKLADLMAKKGKSGLWVNLFHQYFSQFEDPYVLDSILSNTSTQIAFNTPNRKDRDMVVKAMYGGELSDREVSYHLSSLAKQKAVFKIGKDAPVIARIPDVPDIEIPEKTVDSFIREKIFTRPYYYSLKQIKEAQAERISYGQIPDNSQSSRKRTANRKAVGDSNKPKSKSVFDE